MKLTDWYSGDKKPVRVGVYQRDYGNIGLLYSYWDGGKWGVGHHKIHVAYRFGFHFSIYAQKQIPWRGVAK
jgi:hypothetical protein